MKSKNIGIYHTRKFCRFCDSKDLVEILNFGMFPLAGAFIEENDFKNEKFYPLKINYCKNCFLVQVRDIISVDILFRQKYFFFSSAIATLVEHFKIFSSELVSQIFSENNKPTILEIGCNDGVLLKPLSSSGAKCIGVDPATNVTKTINHSDIKVYDDCFTEKLSIKIKEEEGYMDGIVSCYSFAHIDDMDNVMRGVINILKNKGVFIFELYSLGTLIDNMQYDNFYHEHMSYYSIKTLQIFLKKYKMEIFDIKFFPHIRSGATRFYVKFTNNSNRKITKRFNSFLLEEERKGYYKLKTLMQYSERVKKTKINLIKLLEKLKTNGKKIAGYGASGRSTTIMNYCGIDDAPKKQSFFTPGNHLPIKAWDYIYQVGVPDYIVLFSWAFVDEILQKRADYIKEGGRFIIPLPEVRIV